MRGRCRRAIWVTALRARAFWHRAPIDLAVASDMRIGRRVRVILEPYSRNLLHIGPGCILEDDVVIRLGGGQIRFGPRVEIRRWSVLAVTGELEMEGENVLSWSNGIHCAEHVRLERQVGMAERATIADSTHIFTEPDQFFYHSFQTGPVEIGRNTWISANAVISRNVRVGHHCIIGANSVVTKDVPSGHLASGVPAVVVRPLDLPWESPPGMPRPDVPSSVSKDDDAGSQAAPRQGDPDQGVQAQSHEEDARKASRESLL